jgi:hypothetical protein
VVAKARMSMIYGGITSGGWHLNLEFVLGPGKKFDKVKLIP